MSRETALVSTQWVEDNLETDGIVVIEVGIITPPFGLVVFTVKGCVKDPEVTLGDIFKGALPYWAMLLILAGMVYLVPSMATFLPSTF